MKSSLKTFLKGKNPYKVFYRNKLISKLLNSNTIGAVVEIGQDVTVSFYSNGIIFNIDVLDDGTAITYSPML